MAKITVDNLRVVFPARNRAAAVEALADASLRIDDGELACIV
ncbi:MAG: nitrate ABC transporter ATP-binding protein, partial [Chloroflexales bacterium]|nr:nitrate ABC transporter ATP-binding protein [Chloroflexales bacterium]